MKTRVPPVALCLCFLVSFTVPPSQLRAGGAETPTPSKLYDELADGDNQVADALVTAKRENKHILLQFGANWCGWCLKLHKLFESEKAVHDELSTNYVLVLIDVNKDHNKTFAVKHRADNHALPFLVVLDGDGKVLTTKETGWLEEGDHHSPQKVLAFLKAWKPGAPASSRVVFTANPKVTFISLVGPDGGLKQAYYKAENSSASEILCRVHVEQRGGNETASFSIPAGGSTPFSFFVRPGDAPEITAEVLQPGPPSRFLLPLPNEVGAANRSQPARSGTNSTSPAAGSGR